MTNGATDDLRDFSLFTHEFDPVSKTENPKGPVGRRKAPLMSCVPSTSLAWLAEAHLDGHRKYGRLNWRQDPIRITDYLDALDRHLLAFAEGERCSPDSGLPHLAHIMAGASILLDAKACGTLIDDRTEGRPDAFAAVQADVLEIRDRRTV